MSLVARSSDDDVVHDCYQILGRHARSFSLASRFLTRKVRDRAAITYAFCRLVDDAVDEATSASAAQAALDEIEGMLRGHVLPSPIVGAYLRLCRDTQIGLEPAWDLLAGARSDVRRVRVQQDSELLTYCYRVAGTVGLMMCGVLGVKAKQAARFAVDLGIAMQLTNICRDVLEDAEMGRVYLPADRLERHWLHSSGLVLLAKRPDAIPLGVQSGVASVVGELLSLADEYYRSAKKGYQYIPLWPRLSIIFASNLYREIGQEVRRHGGNVLEGRVRVSGRRKFLVLIRSTASWVFSIFRKPAPLVLSAVANHHAPRPLFK
jgi:15-cis-phytoene synthase